ncbi:glycosyltransferase, partial [Alphaproteobacteria bacterium]|nr:glycosyltransferase [Alphaproteobacteria bacterium]
MDRVYEQYSIIIPVRNYNYLLKKCVLEILNFSTKIEIIIVYDEISFLNDLCIDFKEHIESQIILIKSIKKTISAKRNLGVKYSERKYVAFIDSDAFPSSDWLINANNTFREQNEAYCVGGPNISPQDQNFINNAVGAAQKSFLVSGKWNYHKKRGVNNYVSHVPSCNLIVIKSAYLKCHGMNEKIYTGEDLDFCTKINDNGKRIYFDSNVIVFHYDRGFTNYFLQKIFRGSGVAEVNLNFFEKIYLLVPLFFFIFNIMGLVSLTFKISVILSYSYLVIISIYSIISFFETLRYSVF